MVKNEASWLLRALALGWLILVALLLFKILSGPSEIGSPSTESESLIRANERLLEMVKWTISTILLVGGGLIGLNWYQNEKRLESEIERQSKRLDEFRRELSHDTTLNKQTMEFLTERVLNAQMSFFRLKSNLEQTTLAFYGHGKDKSWGEAVLESLDQNPSYPPFVIEIAESFLGILEGEETSNNFIRYLAKPQLEPLAAHMERANRAELAARFRHILSQFEQTT